MGSLNGDIMVIRNGRSTSQISVYNYPEHLNPFYEDDQHKRLRFWKIIKKDNEGRRNSFSIGNLKDMWAFKSFRTKKKSSTLGINKTSESPPTLRRDYFIDNGWNTFDHRLRNSNTSSISGDSFQRNATYRSSLQTLPTSNDRIGLNRNDGYRSTIQVTRSNPRYHPQQQQQQKAGISQNRRYVYSGSVTPQPLRNTNFGRDPYEHDFDSVIIRRSSQSSMASTNPFESDDDENEDIRSSGMKSVNGDSTTTLTTRTPHKKRRAPPPPTSKHNTSSGAQIPTILIESSHDNNNDELRIKEDIDIANLTAEIESFVKIKNNDDVTITCKSEDQTATSVKASVTTTTPKISTTDEEKVETKKGVDNTSLINYKDTKVEEDVTLEDVKKESISNVSISKVMTNITTKDEIKPVYETMNHITTDIISVKTTANGTKDTNEIVTKTNESKTTKSNGAISKKPNNISVASSATDQQQRHPLSTTVVTDLCIKETNNEKLPQKPIPLKRQTKPEAEIGHIECIHVHVESPIATLRKDNPGSLSSFKTTESTGNNEIITTKTPFILTSPPIQKKKPQIQTKNEPVMKETVKILGSPAGIEEINRLNIDEERINAKPEIIVKPILSPKPVTKEPNGKIHAFAEIHKPMRNKFSTNQNGHVRGTSHDENISPPIIPIQKAKQEEKKMNNLTSTQIVLNDKIDNVTKLEEQTNNPLKIVETLTSDNLNTIIQPVNDDEEKEHKEINSELLIKTATTVTSSRQSNELLKPDNEFELLYRPKPATHMEWRQSTLAPLETNIPPEKRKSVKDIIESINRSQRLLNAAANKDFTAFTTTTTIPSGPGFIPTHKKAETNNINNNFNENLKILDERQKEIQRMVNEVDGVVETEGAVATSPCSSPLPSNYNNEYVENQKLNNNEIFQKCKVKKEVYDYRESSPISSNLDWNPVPKPKRTKPGYD